MISLVWAKVKASGPMKISEAEAAQKEILNIARKLAEAGTISLTTNAGSYV